MSRNRKNKAESKLIYFPTDSISDLNYILRYGDEYEKNKSKIVQEGIRRIRKSVEKKVRKLQEEV